MKELSIEQLAEMLSELTAADITKLTEVLYRSYTLQFRLSADQYGIECKVRKEEGVI
jgi:hypothetical protein